MLRAGLICGWTACAVVVLATSSQAENVYVDNVQGDDQNDGLAATVAGGESGPVRTIARALRIAHRGDRVVLTATGEPYRESITLEGGRNSGVELFPFRLIGNGATLDGSQPVPIDAWEHFEGDIFRFRPPHTPHQQLFLNGMPAERRRVEGTNLALPDLPPHGWCYLDRYIYFRIKDGVLPVDLDVSFAALRVGITLYQLQGVRVENLTVQGFQLDGINAHDSVFDGAIIGVIARGNGRSGISIGGASRVSVEACLLGNNGQAQLRTEGYCKAAVTNCDLIPNTAPAWVVDGGQLTINGVPTTSAQSPMPDGAEAQPAAPAR